MANKTKTKVSEGFKSRPISRANVEISTNK